MTPSISVVTVTFNAAKDLPQLFESLRGQSDSDFGCVVLDGASTDGTQDVIAAASDVVTYSRSEPDQGFFDALNKALAAVETDYYLVMGADDTLFPDAIANYRAIAKRTNADMVVAGVKAGTQIVKHFRPNQRWRSPGAMFTSHSVGTLFRTNLHEQFGKYTMKYPIFGDSLFMKKVCLAEGTEVVLGDFVAGDFNIEGGFSKQNIVRSICELWMMQRETGENPMLQFLLFQARLLRHLHKVVT